MVGKVTAGLASHGPRVTDISGFSTYVLFQGLGEEDEHPPTLFVEQGRLYLSPFSAGHMMETLVAGDHTNLFHGHTQFAQIRRSKIANVFLHKDGGLENDSLPYRLPVKTVQNWCDVVTESNSGL